MWGTLHVTFDVGTFATYSHLMKPLYLVISVVEL